MPEHGGHVIRLEFLSSFAMLDLVQAASDSIGHLAGLDEDEIHWVGVALRESVINAVTHGNQQDARKRVFVELAVGALPDGSTELVMRVRDEGPGFDPDALEDPLAPENLLKASGRGIFIIRNFMDDVDLYR